MDIHPGAIRIDITTAVVSKICVQGRIAPNWGDRFEDMAISTVVTSDGVVITTLQGVLPDQAALVGVINGLHDLRLAVLCVECLANVPAGEDTAAGSPSSTSQGVEDDPLR